MIKAEEWDEQEVETLDMQPVVEYGVDIVVDEAGEGVVDMFDEVEVVVKTVVERPVE